MFLHQSETNESSEGDPHHGDQVLGWHLNYDEISYTFKSELSSGWTPPKNDQV